MKVKSEALHLKGGPICRGIAIGKPFFFTVLEDEQPVFSMSESDIAKEVQRYQKAVQRSREDIQRLKKQLENDQILDGAAILDAHLQMMQDPVLTSQVEKKIISTGKNAESVFQEIIKKYQQRFSKMTDPFFRERFKDILGISKRILGYLRQNVRISLSDLPRDSIVFAKELSAADVAEADSSFAGAIVTESDAIASHAAIIAKARGIPFVSSVDIDAVGPYRNDDIIVDGRTGEVILGPDPETLAKYRLLKEQLGSHLEKISQTKIIETETYDGYKVRLSANIEMAAELDLLHQYGGNGVGLFRSEYIFLSGTDFPSEEEQFQVYKGIVEKMQGLPIVIRTFDLGGDKFLPSRPVPQENNPFLGCRAIRFLLRERDLFKIQLRAILRASVYGDVSIMFPMVSTLSEMIEAKALVKEVQEELFLNGLQVHPIRIGCMIEVPSAAIIADLLAKECDFLSIGTNDLVQYSLAVDRGNQAMSGLYTPTHPSVIRLIRLVASEANLHGIPVTVCGEIAADPRFTPLLLGLGIHELSVASRYIPLVRNAIRNTSIVRASQLAEKALNLGTALEIQELISREYRQTVPDDCYYNC